MKGTNKEGICEWFSHLKKIVHNYGLQSSKIYNMMGVGGKERVVVPEGDQAASFRSQPGNRDSAMVVECIGSGEKVLPPLVITKGQIHTVGEHQQMEEIPSSWHFSKSLNGWTSIKLATKWLEHIFDPNTMPMTPSQWYLLIIDRHRTHTNSAFVDMLWSHQIIPFCLLPHSTYIMQPLDVSIFSPLTRAY